MAVMRMKDFLYLALAFMLGAVIGYFHGFSRSEIGEVITDTIVHTDTVREREIVVKDSIVARTIVKTLPVVRTDTLVRVDSVEVVVPIVSKCYEGENYRAWVSGYEPSLDSIDVFKRTEVVTNTVYAPKKRFGLGVQVGVGFNGKITPYIGIGVQYNLISF